MIKDRNVSNERFASRKLALFSHIFQLVNPVRYMEWRNFNRSRSSICCVTKCSSCSFIPDYKDNHLMLGIVCTYPNFEISKTRIMPGKRGFESIPVSSNGILACKGSL